MQLYKNKYSLYKNEPTDKIWWVDYYDKVGFWVFTFDKKKYFEMWRDYPYELTPEQIKVFDKENPYWAHFFRTRKKDYIPTKQKSIKEKKQNNKK